MASKPAIRFLISASFHEYPSAIAGYVQNWTAAFNGKARILAHLSASSDLRSANLPDPVKRHLETGELEITPTSIRTKFGSALPMHFHNFQHAEARGGLPEYIYLASPYLYAFKRDIDLYVDQYDFGISSDMQPMPHDWHWRAAMEADTRSKDMFRYLGIIKPCITRVDGCFMKRDLMREAMSILLKFYKPEDFFKLDPVYPLEEVLFPALAKTVFRNEKIGDSRAKVWEPWFEEKFTEENVSKALKSWKILCGKRIPQKTGDPIRDMVLSHVPGQNFATLEKIPGNPNSSSDVSS